MRNIIIIGSRGYQYNYGGWETFVKEFVDNNHDDVNFYIPRLVDKKELDKKIELLHFKKMHFDGFITDTKQIDITNPELLKDLPITNLMILNSQ